MTKLQLAMTGWIAGFMFQESAGLVAPSTTLCHGIEEAFVV
jgi:hypothetical protein